MIVGVIPEEDCCMRRNFALTLLLLVLAGCAPRGATDGLPPLESNPPANGTVNVYDGTSRSYNSVFDPSKGTFPYWTVAIPDHPIDSPEAEAWRMRGLEGALAEHGMCASGYKVESRKPKTLSSAQYLILYDGHCN
jgi:hypothetical protein